MRVSSLYLAASFIAIACSSPALAGEDVGAGHEIYQTQCSPCHSNQPGVNGIGPSLAGLAGRKAGSLPGFHFTPALQGSGLTWDTDTFIQFLADPSKLVPGTAMKRALPPSLRASRAPKTSFIEACLRAIPARTQHGRSPTAAPVRVSKK